MKTIADNLHPEAACVLLAALIRASGGTLTIPGVAESQATIHPYFRIEVKSPDDFTGEGWPEYVVLTYSGVDELPEGATTNGSENPLEELLRQLSADDDE